MRTIFTAVLLSIVTLTATELPPPGTHEYIVSTVYVSQEEEHVVAELYDRFLALLVGGKIEPGAKLPAGKAFCTETESYAIFHRSYYIAPDELRGFEISIPKKLLKGIGESYVVTAALQVDKVAQKQNIRIITMKKSPNQTVQGTGASRSVQESNRTPSAAGSRR